MTHGDAATSENRPGGAGLHRLDGAMDALQDGKGPLVALHQPQADQCRLRASHHMSSSIPGALCHVLPSLTSGDPTSKAACVLQRQLDSSAVRPRIGDTLHLRAPTREMSRCYLPFQQRGEHASWSVYL